MRGRSFLPNTLLAVAITVTAGADAPAVAWGGNANAVCLLAFGDINLGRRVGQEILRGDTLFPFAYVQDTIKAYDLVFANLESPLSDQDGETQDPENNLVFTGPPAGAASLQRAGVTVVSTANNHAIDYGIHALRETIVNLRHAGVAFAGTATGGSDLYRPAFITVKGIRFAVFAVTDIMNSTAPVWRRYVAAADTAQLFPAMRAARDSADFMIVSYHGGNEYADTASGRTRDFAAAAIRAGADLFLGHHPHVPYGIGVIRGKYAVYSLGNFVFRQPARYWTQRSFAFAADIVRDSTGARITSFRCLPLECGLQPKFLPGDGDGAPVLQRIKSQSTHDVAERTSW